MALDVLPDSRLTRSIKGAKRMLWGQWGTINVVPIFCANCGKLRGYCPEENMTFAFYLCDSPCAEQWATLAGTYTTTDEQFFQKCAEAMVEEHGHYLTEKGVEAVEFESGRGLATLLRESPFTRR